MRVVVFAAAFAAVIQAAAFAQAPHTFTAGEPAKASEVNENFEALDTRITTNADAIAANEAAIDSANAAASAGVKFVLVDSDDQVIGDIVDVAIQGGQLVNAVVNFQIDLGGGERDVMMKISPTATAENSIVYFTADGCMGQGYIAATKNAPLVTGVAVAVENVSGDVSLAIGPADPSVTYIESRMSGANCLDASFATSPTLDYYEVSDTFNFYAKFPPPYHLEKR